MAFINPVRNYIYLHHLGLYLFLPVYPETLSDTSTAGYSQNPIMMRSAPLYAYVSSGPRQFSITLKVHREILNDLNADSLVSDGLNYFKLNSTDDYGDVLINCIEACAVPKYSSTQKMVNPPMVSLKLGDGIYIKGVVNGGVSVNYSGPILTINGKDKYACIDLAMTICEVTPFDASDILDMGSYRINTTLVRDIYTTGNPISQVTNDGGSGLSSSGGAYMGGRSFSSGGGGAHMGGRSF